MDQCSSVMNHQLFAYKQRYDKAFRMSEVFANAGSKRFLHTDPAKETAFSKLQGFWAGVRLFFNGVGAVVSHTYESGQKKRKLRKILKCQAGQVITDINELSKQKDGVTCLGMDFTYDATIDATTLVNVTDIFGDAHLEAMKDMSCLANLENVWGSIGLPKDADISQMKLKVVYGDVHAEQLSTKAGLEDLEFVGGKIYYRN